MDEQALANLVRIGTVTSVESGKCRVKFQDVDITSGWLYVLQHKGATLSISQNGNPAHKHTGSLSAWTPKINDTVVCLYIPVFNGDGFILGGI